MNTRKISKLANELIMDELLGTGTNDESNFPKDILDELEFAFQDCQRKVDSKGNVTETKTLSSDIKVLTTSSKELCINN